MTLRADYLLTGSAAATDGPGARGRQLLWPDQPGTTDTVETEIGWHAQPLPNASPAAIDLLRIAGGAYLADRLTRRGTGFIRELTLTVALREPDRWTAEVSNETCDLLRWLTGDAWTLSLIPDSSSPTGVVDAASASSSSGEPHAVALLSGGLDSFLGALHLLGDVDKRGNAEPDAARLDFVGHKDAAKAVRAAQNAVTKYLSAAFTPPPSYARFALRQVGTAAESSSRSRSLLFFAIGVAAATDIGGQRLHVPENGYTSLNLPLHASRGGALSTRSTHPTTFARVNQLLASLGIPVELDNPFALLTKGESMRTVAATNPPPGWLDAAALTMSCSKLDGARLRSGGGNANLHCGLCVPCIVRRGTFISAGQTDHTRYLIDELSNAGRDELIARRHDDIDAVLYATAQPLDELLIDSGTWPTGYDLDAAATLAQRGLDELAAVPLP